MKLYDLTGKLLEIEELIEAGEIDDDVLLDTWESIDAVFEDKADGYAKVIRNFEASAEALKAEEQRIGKRRKSYENAAKRLRAALQSAMIVADKRKIKTELFTFSIQANQPKLVIDDEAALPDGFKVVTYTPDKSGLKKALQAGDEIEGVHLEASESLRIR